MGRQRCCRCGRCEKVQCYTNLQEDGTQRVNETEFVLTNIPNSISLWTFAPGIEWAGIPNQFFKHTSLEPTELDTWVGAKAIEGTYQFTRNSSCLFRDESNNSLRVVFAMRWLIEVFYQDPGSYNDTGSNILTKIAEREEPGNLQFDFIHDNDAPWGSAVAGPEQTVFDPPWYMHYIQVTVFGNPFANLTSTTNPIRPKATAQATCGKSYLTWESIPFYEYPYPYSPAIDFSAYAATYAEDNAYGPGSTAESFS